MRRNQRSPEAQSYRHLYKTPVWQAARGRQLSRHPLCQRHLKRNKIVPATVVHHRKPHKGDWRLFVAEWNLESLCKTCHDSEVQSEERLGYSKAVGEDGFPTDRNHPFNRVSGGGPA